MLLPRNLRYVPSLTSAIAIVIAFISASEALPTKSQWEQTLCNQGFAGLPLVLKLADKILPILKSQLEEYPRLKKKWGKENKLAVSCLDLKTTFN